jgi:hypothetical protein
MVVYLAGGASIIALMATVAHGWVWLLFPWLGLCGWYVRSLRCPECRKPIANNYGIWMPYVPRRCSQCGHDLTARVASQPPRPPTT